MYEKMISNIQEIKSRKGPVIAIATEGDDRIKEVADEVIEVPTTLDYLNPILCAVPCQLLAYHCARFLNREESGQECHCGIIVISHSSTVICSLETGGLIAVEIKWTTPLRQ
jgi:hypothetical protein